MELLQQVSHPGSQGFPCPLDTTNPPHNSAVHSVPKCSRCVALRATQHVPPSGCEYKQLISYQSHVHSAALCVASQPHDPRERTTLSPWWDKEEPGEILTNVIKG